MGNTCICPEELSEQKKRTKTFPCSENSDINILKRANPIQENEETTNSTTNKNRYYEEYRIGEVIITTEDLNRVGFASESNNSFKLSNSDGSSYINMERVYSIDDLDSFNSESLFSSKKSSSKKSNI